MSKRLLSLLMAVLMVASMLPVTALAADVDDSDESSKTMSMNDTESADTGTGDDTASDNINPASEESITVGSDVEVGGLNYKVTAEGQVAVSDNKSAVGDIVIPASITVGDKEYAVVSVVADAFNNADEVTSIVVPDSVTTLGGAAFANMDKLQTITIGNGVTSWGDKLAVNNYELETVVIAEGATLIGNIAFRTCPKLANVTLPSTLKSIGATAFAYSAITELNIPASVETIGADAFKDIDTLKKVTFLGENTKLGSTCFQMCDGLEEVVLPANLTEIPQGAFRYCTSLKIINFPESLTEIGNYSFQGCTSLESVTISKNITKLVTNAFNGCTSLKNLTFEEGFAGTIGAYVFQGCTALESVVIPSTMETVGESMFNGCTSLKNVTLSEGVKTLNISAFANCTSLETLTLPDSLERMRHGSIANCTALKTLVITGEDLPVIEHSNALDGLSDNLIVYYSGDGEFTGNWATLANNVKTPPTTIDLSQGSYTITEAGEYVVSPYTGENTLTIQADANVELQGVNITAAEGVSAISIESGNVTLNVTADSTVKGGKGGAGIYVAEGASVTIKGGKLTAIGNGGADTSDSGAAGIGGTYTNGNSGAITIDGATVVAEGYGVHGSGIGSGSGEVVGEIKIVNGANVTAYGGYYANGAGTKLQSNYGKTDPEGGAAIGGGGKTGSTIADITITDSTVVAYGGSKAAGIGANFWSSCGTITISGNSDVTAQGGSSSAGIGTSRVNGNTEGYISGSGANIIIEDGKVTATGGAYGAGIGGGYNADSAGNNAEASLLETTTIAISGGTVNATGGEGGAGIGGGYKTDNVNIDITGGNVTAAAGDLVSGKTVENGGAACAIGSGANGSGKFENSPDVEIGASASVEATAYYGGKQAIEGHENDEVANNVTLTLIGEPDYIAKIGTKGYVTLTEAVTAANKTEGGATVTLLSDVTLGEKLTISGNVTISGEHTITRDDTYTGTLFAISSGATLTLDGDLTIDGNNNWTLNEELYNKALNLEAENVSWAGLITSEEGKPDAAAPMFLVNGSVVANNVTIQNNYSSKSSNNGDYGVFKVEPDATLTMTGATVKHIVTGGANSVAHLSTNAVWTINDGTMITDTFAARNGGVCRNDSGKLIMNGGEISNNDSINTNGTVVMLYKGTMEMNGGKICSNTGISGTNNGRCAPIYGHSTSTFVMTGGEICHNTGISYGGVDVPSSIKVEISGGYIGKNVSVIGNANADVNGNSNTVITSGTFTQDVSKWLAADLGMAYNEETGTYGVTEDIAEVNGTAYQSVAAAVEAASAGDTVKVLASHKPGDTIVIDKNITLDLNGKNILGYSTVNPIVRVLADVTVTGNGMIDSANQGDGYCFIVGDTTTSGNLTIENGTFKGTTSAISVTKGKLTILDGDFRVKPYTDDDDNKTYEYLLNCIDANYKDGSAVIEVKGGTFTSFNPADNAAEGANTNFVAEGYISETNDEGATYTVRQAHYVAQVGENKYESLSEAVSQAGASDTITLIADHAITAPVVIEKNVTIDLNGYTITGVQVYPVIRVQGGANVTVKDSSENQTGGITNEDYVFVLGASDGSSAGNLTIESGTYHGDTTVASVTKGTLTITGGEFAVSESEYGATYLLNCIDANYTDGSAKIVVSGGSFTGFNPENNAAETGGNTNFCAPYYVATEAEGVYTVAEWDYSIDSKDELVYFNKLAQDLVNAGVEPFSGKTVTLTADIDMDWAEWYPINFYGTFEGGNHTIRNLTYIPRADGRMGFFQLVSGPVSNLTLDGIKGTVPANGRFGGFARYLNSAVENIHVKNIEVKTTDTLAWVGGFTTYTAGGSTTNCSVENLDVDATAGADLIAGFASLTSNRQLYSNSDVIGFKVTITDSHSSGCGVGGWAAQTQTGWNNPKFEDCDVTGIDVAASGLVDVGGFIAWPGAHTEYANNCHTAGKIDVTGVTSEDCFAGGFFGNLGWNCDLGYMGHVLNNCSANVEIITKFAPAGGFVGSATNSNDNSMYATFNNCSASGNITCVEGGTADIGGFAGDADRGAYNDCSASGTVTNNGTGNAGQYIGAIYDVTPKYDYRYPAGTRDYLVDKITVADCTYTGTSELKFIGNTAENADVTVVNYVAQIGETKYESLQEALNAAEPGETVKLLKDSTENIVVVSANVTLDLNGCYLTASNLLSFGDVIDTAATTGGLVIDIDTTKAFTVLQSNNQYLPIYDMTYNVNDSVGCYRFYEYNVVSVGAPDGTSDSVKFKFRMEFTKVEAYNVLAQTEESGVSVILTLDWTGLLAPIPYTFKSSTVQAWAGNMYKGQTECDPPKTASMMLTVNGLATLPEDGSISATPSVQTVTGANASGNGENYTPTAE